MSNIDTTSLTKADRNAIADKIRDLNTRYGTKTEITKINWKDGTYHTAESKHKAFTLENGARVGTYRVVVAGQQGVTKRVEAKAPSKGSSSADSSTGARSRKTAAV